MLLNFFKKIIEVVERLLKNLKKEKIQHVRVQQNYYKQKQFITNYENYFFQIFKELERNYPIIIHPQVPLSSIVQKINGHKYQNELYRTIDFAIFTKDYKDLLLLIEINDKTHYQSKRKTRDKKIKVICTSANIKLITFYSKYDNKYSYVKNRVETELNTFFKNSI